MDETTTKKIKKTSMRLPYNLWEEMSEHIKAHGQYKDGFIRLAIRKELDRMKPREKERND